MLVRFSPKKNVLTFSVFLLLIISFFKNGTGFLHAQTLIRGPYLQQLSKNGVTIRWRTDVPSNEVVTFQRQDSSKVFSIKNTELISEHIIQLTDLKANTKYSYTVGTNDKTLASGKDFYFITAPDATQSRPINIWTMGDFGASLTEKYVSNQTSVRDQYLKNKENHTDLWLWLGDNAYCCGTDVEYQKQIFDFYGSSILGNIAIFPSPGNHEYYETATAQVDKKINYYNIITVPTKAEMGGFASNTKEYYSYNYGNIHFVALDSYGLDEGKHRLYDPQSKQYQWLLRDLEANKGKSLWTIIYFHHPPYTKRSHDSNAEPELVSMRENLVPIFDKYKVDLVLSGHSHTYERSYLMKGHTGHSLSFDAKIHAVQNVNGKYENTAGSAPFINKDEGTIYCVVGSAGRLDWNGDPNPHPSSIYSNVTIGGSLLLSVNNNRLDARWVAADGIIRDNFTLFKNVNKTEKLTVGYGEKVQLTASWKGSHRWSNGVKNQESLIFTPKKDTTITDIDSLGFLKDNFQISVLPQPKTSIKTLDFSQICVKNKAKINFEVQNTTFDKWTYQLELSDPNGLFDKPTILDKSNKNSFEIILPDTLRESKNYRFRVQPNVDFFESIPSQAFSINRPASINFVGEKTVAFDSTINLKLRLEGTPPFTYKISTLPEGVSENKEINIKVKPIETTTYILEKVSNVCGMGNVLADNKVLVLAPLSTEDEQNQVVNIFPNPTSGEITIHNQSGKPLKGILILRDLSGKKILQKSINITHDEKLSLQEFPAGTYLLILRTHDFKFSKKIIKI